MRHARPLQTPLPGLSRRLLTDVGADEVNRRVAYWLIVHAARSIPPGGITHPPSWILDLALHYRAAGFGYIYWTLQWYARNVASGYSSKELRALGPDGAHRALHKQRVRR